MSKGARMEGTSALKPDDSGDVDARESAVQEYHREETLCSSPDTGCSLTDATAKRRRRREGVKARKKGSPQMTMSPLSSAGSDDSEAQDVADELSCNRNCNNAVANKGGCCGTAVLRGNDAPLTKPAMPPYVACNYSEARETVVHHFFDREPFNSIPEKNTITVNGKEIGAPLRAPSTLTSVAYRDVESQYAAESSNCDAFCLRSENRSWSIDRKTYDMQRVLEHDSSSVAAEESKTTGAKWSFLSSLEPEHSADHSTDTVEDYLLQDETAMSKDHNGNLIMLSLGALGIVFGDIGTSPLYTVQAMYSSVEPEPDAIVGGISTLIWMILLIVTFKYVVIVLRVHNRGEGGIMALTALAARACEAASWKWLKVVVLSLGVLGTTMFYADSIITPAITVLSALEGIELATPVLHGHTLPIALVILMALFSIQRFGTGVVGALFGPLLVVWFLMLAVTGIQQISLEPLILNALNPVTAVNFLADQNAKGDLMSVMGHVVLGVTGSECLYADLGHFGPLPIRLSWLTVTMPALFLNYLGQGALLIRDPSKADNPFYHMFPDSFLYPAVAMSSLATVVASQAVISGSFSITCEAISLGYLPRLTVLHTSKTKKGQIYIPSANYLLGAAVFVVAAVFGKASSLANAYGLSVTMTMAITTLLVSLVGVRSCVSHSRCYLLAPMLMVMGGILALDLLLLISCVDKFFDGAWLPFAVAVALFAAMTTWAKGTRLLRASIQEELPPLAPFLSWLTTEPVHRTSRTAVYAVTDLESVPPALVLNLRHNKALHETLVILKVSFSRLPTVEDRDRLVASKLAEGYWRVEAVFGFKEQPDIPAVIARLAADYGLPVTQGSVSYFLFRPLVAPRAESSLVSLRDMSLLRKWIFMAMHHNAGSADRFYRIPRAETMELGADVLI